MLTAKYKMSYKDPESKQIKHIYIINGSDDELKAYVDQKNEELAPSGKTLPMDDVTGKPLFFTKFMDQDTLTIERNDRSGKYYTEGCPKLKMLRDKLALAEDVGTEREINRIEDRILDLEMEIVMERDKRKRKSPVKEETDAPGTNL